MSFDIDEFEKISNIKCPNYKFEENNILFNLKRENYDYYDEEDEENEEEEDENEINTNTKKFNNNNMD